MNTQHDNRILAHQVSFRITEEQHQAFTDLVRTVPGADVGSMLREVFSRGLRDLEAFYEKVYSHTRAEVAAELEVEPEQLHDDPEDR